MTARFITCPSCRQEEPLGDLEVPERGRLYACGTCDHVWTLRREAIVQAAVTEQAPDATAANVVLPAATRPRRRFIILLAAASVAACCVAGAWLYLHARAAAPEVYPERPLMIIDPTIEANASGNAVTVEFHVENPNARTKTFEQACVSLIDESGHSAFRWCSDGTRRDLGAHSRLSISFDVLNPPARVRNLEIQVR
ncbi:MAG: hypothetical protein FJX35_11580 [Alphaproteobacteria bacterium]|nr:hypothetical protein [Alphaproteobacteria bacterium]